MTRANPLRRHWAVALAIALAAAAAFLSGIPPASAAGGARPDRPRLTVVVFAAASLTDAFRDLAAVLQQRDPMLEVRFNFAGSQQLATQLEQGAGADVFASADQRWMAYVAERRLLDGKPQLFAQNRLVVIMPRSNPVGIRRLEDLAGRGLKLVVAAAAVPAGKYTREALQNLANAPGFSAGYAKAVLANIVSEEENVKSVAAKVRLGEADAGVVYQSDVTSGVAPYVTVLQIPEPYNVLASYPIAVLKGAREPVAANTFVNLVLSKEGRHVLRRHGLIPASASARNEADAAGPAQP